MDMQPLLILRAASARCAGSFPNFQLAAQAPLQQAAPNTPSAMGKGKGKDKDKKEEKTAAKEGESPLRLLGSVEDLTPVVPARPRVSISGVDATPRGRAMLESVAFDPFTTRRSGCGVGVPAVAAAALPSAHTDARIAAYGRRTISATA
ncbi:hypothetical protein ON010_g11908 [Phytophthora cinnamomi]|nr:hypothetical protein ON010_g11908 [Phytophthora cinnamomi]